jgi:hypothetical protein
MSKKVSPRRSKKQRKMLVPRDSSSFKDKKK